MKESFEKELAVLRELGPATFVLRGSTLIVEIQEPEEIKTKSGIVLSSSSDHVKGGSAQAHRVEVGLVLMAGQGYWDESRIGYQDENSHRTITEGQYNPLECQPGAIVLLPQYSTQLMSHFPGISRPTGNKLAMIKMDQVLAYYPSQEAYELAKQKLNE